MSNPETGQFWGCFFDAGCGSAPDWLSCVAPCAAQYPSAHAALLAYYRCIECGNCPSCAAYGWTKYYGCG